MTDAVRLRKHTDWSLAPSDHVDVVAFGDVNKVYHVPLRSLAVNVSVQMIRRERGTCAVCGKRRVRFQLVVNTHAESDAVCGPCAGLR